LKVQENGKTITFLVIFCFLILVLNSHTQKKVNLIDSQSCLVAIIYFVLGCLRWDSWKW